MTSFVYASAKVRVFAKLIDLSIVLLLGFAIQGGVGSVLGFLYSICADGLPIRKLHCQSVGKHFLKLRVISQSGEHPLRSSIIRNAPVGLVTFLMIIPFWGWILSLLVGIPLGLYEISLMFRADKHQRLGDVMAETVVVKNV
jgi:uncharacterized RDD family membrane protein YckC